VSQLSITDATPISARMHAPNPGLVPVEHGAHGTLAVSQLLEELHDAFPNDMVTVRELVDRLEGRAFGLLLLMLALPMCIPNIPGISTIFGILLLAPALQLMLLRRSVWLPRRICQWSFKREHLQQAIRGALPVLKRIEHYVQPRLSFLTAPPVTMLLGLHVLLMAFVLILPIPAGNWPPGITIAMTALALLQRDGLLALLSIPVGVASLFVAYVGLRIGYAALSELIDIGATILSGHWPM
jgi:hypothetical protein